MIPKRFRLPFTLATLAVAAVVGCGDDSTMPPVDRPGEVVFDAYYGNEAWGYVLRGNVIDVDGVIWEYDRGADVWQPEVTEGGRYPESSLREKFKGAKRVGRIDADVLPALTELILEAAQGAITRTPVGADFGQRERVAYLFDSETRTYELVMLASTGDWEISNSSEAAQQLDRWLADVLPDAAGP